MELAIQNAIENATEQNFGQTAGTAVQANVDRGIMLWEQQYYEFVEQAEQERLALLGETILDQGGMPTAEQLTAMGMDEATARGIQSLVWLSKENDPAARRAVETMIDLTDSQTKLEPIAGVVGGENGHPQNHYDGLNRSALFGMVDAESANGVAQPEPMDKTLPDFKNLAGSTISEVVRRIPRDALSRKLHPVEGGATEGVEYKWVQNGQTYRVRIHNEDPGAPKGSNAASGWIVRIQRGRQYFDYTINDFQPAKYTNPHGEFFDEMIMNNTHIPILHTDESNRTGRETNK